MSVRATSWVWEHSEADGNARLVLLAIADFCPRNGNDCFADISALVHMTRINARTVQRAIYSLEAMGELDVLRKPGRPNHYRMPHVDAHTHDKLSSPAVDNPRQTHDTWTTPGRQVDDKLSGVNARAHPEPEPDLLTTNSLPRAGAREDTNADELFGVREPMADAPSPLHTLQELGFELEERDYAWAQAELHPTPTRQWVQNATADWLDYRSLRGVSDERDTPAGWDKRWRADLLRKAAAGWGRAKGGRQPAVAATDGQPRPTLLELRT